jgi:predicted CXXCH cytochrome family protein
LGIACEACHGPGADHIAAYRDPLRRYIAHVSGHSGDAIVNPPRLPPRAASAVCGQCHGVFVFSQPQHWRTDGADYRPGGVLDNDRYLVGGTADAPPELPALTREYIAERFWPDGEVRVSGREYTGLAASACFQRGDLSCLQCHSMHASAPDAQLRPDRDGDRACLPCHAREVQAGPAHTHHATESAGSRCTNCHMPYTTFGLLKAIRTHRITSPNVAATLATGRPDACNLCHVDRTLAWSAEHLTAWYGAPAVELSDDERTIAASLVWLLRGDAGQRALAAWSLGWAPAQAASTTAWMAPFLAVLLDDPYSAVRYTAARSLRTLPGYADLEYDFVGRPAEWRRTQEDVMARWHGAGTAARPELLIAAGGGISRDAADALRHRRDDHPVALSE